MDELKDIQKGGNVKVKCTCIDWQNNINLINAPFTLHLTVVGEYKGKKFKFCPWCGLKLIKEL
jgi:hypothetical protein